MYIKRGFYLCNAIMVMDFVIDIQQLITPLRNNIFQCNLVIVSAIYWGLNVRNFI